MPVFPDRKVSFWPQVSFVSQVCLPYLVKQTYQQDIGGLLISCLDSPCVHLLFLVTARLNVGLQVIICSTMAV